MSILFANGIHRTWLNRKISCLTVEPIKAEEGRSKIKYILVFWNKCSKAAFKSYKIFLLLITEATLVKYLISHKDVGTQ